MNVKMLSVGLGGFGLGAFLSWAFTADHFERKARVSEELLEARVEVLRKRANMAYESQMRDGLNYKAEIERLESKLDLENSQGDILSEASEEESFGEETVEETRSNLQKIIDTYTGDGVDSSDMVETAVEIDRKVPPFVIPIDEFASGEEGWDYDKISLTYYPQHRILTDDEDEPVENVAKTVGWRNLAQFGGESEQPDVVYIRNRAMRTDFEVIRDEENELPLHIKYGMGKSEFETNRAAGIVKLRPEDRD